MFGLCFDNKNDEYLVILLSLELHKVVGDELLSWVIMFRNIKILSVLSFFCYLA